MNLYFSDKPLLNAAMPLLVVLANLKQIQNPEYQLNVAFRQKAAEAIENFVKESTENNCQSRQILAARYCLCTAFDEFILTSQWGIKNNWHHLPLLSLIHKETFGGERFFIILEEIAKSPKENLQVLELLYLILNLGFEGQYYNESSTILPQIRHQLFSLIKQHEKEPNKWLSPSLKSLQNLKSYNPDSRYKLKVAVIMSSIVVGVAFTFNLITYSSSRKPLAQLEVLSQQTAHIPLPVSQLPASSLALLNSKPLTVVPHPKLTHHQRVKHRGRA